MEKLEYFWSPAAAEAAKGDLPGTMARVREEASEIASQARGWFIHTISLNGFDLLCTGEERNDAWTVCVQVATFKHRDGSEVNFPRPEQTRQNEPILSPDEVMLGVKPFDACQLVKITEWQKNVASADGLPFGQPTLK